MLAYLSMLFVDVNVHGLNLLYTIVPIDTERWKYVALNCEVLTDEPLASSWTLLHIQNIHIHPHIFTHMYTDTIWAVLHVHKYTHSLIHLHTHLGLFTESFRHTDVSFSTPTQQYWIGNPQRKEYPKNTLTNVHQVQENHRPNQTSHTYACTPIIPPQIQCEYTSDYTNSNSQWYKHQKVRFL